MQKLIRVRFSGMQYQIGSDQLILGQIFKASIFNIIMKIIRLFWHSQLCIQQLLMQHKN